MQADIRTDFWQQVVAGEEDPAVGPVKAAMAGRVAGRPDRLELASVDAEPLGTLEQHIGLDNLDELAGCHRCRLDEFRLGVRHTIRAQPGRHIMDEVQDRKSTRLNSSHVSISY